MAARPTASVAAMIAFFIASLSIADAFAQGACRQAQKPIGGTAAQQKHWPSFAALRLYHPDTKVGLQFCGATAIASDWLLTAAHCFDDLPGMWRGVVKSDDTSRLEIQAVIGVASLDDAKESDVYPTERYIQHEKYAQFYKDALARDPLLAANTAVRVGHDIALVKLARPWRGAVSKLSLSPETDPKAAATGAKQTMIVAGFGATVPSGNDIKMYTRTNRQKYYANSPDLLEVGLPLVDHSRCRATAPGTASITSDQFCAGFGSITRKDSCNGDSGGPLVSLDDKLCPRQIGLVSWGPSPCAPQHAPAYGVYTRISAFAGWIKRYVPSIE